MDVQVKKKYICELCNTEYCSRQSLWNHNNKFHQNKDVKCIKKCNKNVTKNVHIVTDCNTNKLTCIKCNLKFNNRQTKWRHEKNCTITKNNNTENEILQNQMKQMETKMEEMKNMIGKLLKSRKIHPKTLNKINNNINNGTINNNIIVKFGNVNINDVLTAKQIMNILYKPFVSTEECIKMIHMNDDLPQYNNIFITNLKDDLAYIYDGKEFVTATKTEVIMELIDNYVEQVEISFDDNKDKMSESKIKCVENYLKLINSEKQYIDQFNKVYPSFKAYKIGDVKRLIYDKSDPKKFAIICKNIQNTEIEV